MHTRTILRFHGSAYLQTRTLLVVTGILLQLGCVWGGHERVWGNEHQNWLNHGAGILNHRSVAGHGQKISACSVPGLALKWKFSTGFDVTATPSVANETIFFPGWNGNVYALNAKTGVLIWKTNLTELTGVRTVARATPVIHEHLLLVGLDGPAIVLALDLRSGALVWKTEFLEDAPLARITMSGTVFEGFYLVGTSSGEEFFNCCSFQGSFQKIRLTDGSVVWRTYMLPRKSGYYGAALWGSSPAVDERRRLVYIATGNNYQVPKSVEQCELRRSNNTRQNLPDECEIPDDRQDSMLALNVDDGTIVWSRQFQGYDVWTYACSMNNTPNCPAILGQDYDFGEAPMLLHFDKEDETACGQRCSRKSTVTCLVVAGQKSGAVWALDCESGSIVWSTVSS